VPEPAPRLDADLVVAARAGETGAFGTLFERWFDPVYDVARNIVRNADTAADVAQDTFLTAWQRLATLERPEAFGGWILRIARNRALNRLERDGRVAPLAGAVVTGLHDDGAPDPVGSTRSNDTEELVEAHEHSELIAVAAAALGERDASLLDLHLRHGLTPAEIADELDITPNNAHQLLFRLRAKLGNAISASMLWNEGAPTCERLAAELAAVTAFDGSTVAVIDRHTKQCPDCADDRKALVLPWKLFAAVPIAIAPLVLRTRTAHALHAAGVPVGGGPAGGAAVAGGASGGGGASGVSTAGWIGIAAAAIVSVGLPIGLLIARDRGGAEVVGGAVAAETADTADTIQPPPGDDDPVGAPVVAADTTTSVVSTTTTSSTTSTSVPSTSADAGASSPPAAVPPPATSTTTSTAVTPTTATTATTPSATSTTAPTATPSTTAAPATPTTTPAATIPASTTTTPTTTTPTTTAPTTSTVPVDAPVIVAFVLDPDVRPGGPTACTVSGEAPRRFEWSSTGGTSAQLVTTRRSTSVEPSGSAVICSPLGTTVTLVVTGPGGTVSTSVDVPA
jgi:RNA polymerase sigma factor (sigma-70 family)